MERENESILLSKPYRSLFTNLLLIKTAQVVTITPQTDTNNIHTNLQLSCNIFVKNDLFTEVPTGI